MRKEVENDKQIKDDKQEIYYKGGDKNLKNIMRIAFVVFFGLAVLFAGGVKKAEALMMVSVSDGTTTVEYTDDVSGFTSLTGPAPALSLGDLVLGLPGNMMTTTHYTLGLEFTSTTDQSKPILGTAVFPIIDLTGSATGAGTFTLKLTDTGFGPTTPANFPAFGMAVGGTHPGAGSWSMTVDYFADTSNTPFGEGTALGSLSPTLGAFGQFAAGTVSSPFTGALYSLTMKAVITQSGGTTTFNAHTAPVPEPGTIVLLGIGLAGLVGAGVRKHRKRKSATTKESCNVQ